MHNSHHFGMIDWIVIPAPLVWPIWPWFDVLWRHAPTPTAIYMAVSAAFMLFQMFDKLGWLERFKRKPHVAILPEVNTHPED